MAFPKVVSTRIKWAAEKVVEVCVTVDGIEYSFKMVNAEHPGQSRLAARGKGCCRFWKDRDSGIEAEATHKGIWFSRGHD